MGTHPIFESDFDCLTDVKMSLKDIKSSTSSIFSDLINGVRQQWPLLLSAGLIIIELRKLRDQLIQINQEINRLSDSNNSIGFGRRARNSVSGTSADDWFSVYDSDEDEEEELSEEDQEIISRIDELHYSGDKGIRDAWDLIKEKDHSRSIEFLWRKTRSNCSMYGQFRPGSDLGDQPDKRKEFANRALTLAEELIRRAPKLNHGHRYKAAALGCNMEFYPVKEKLANGKIVKECLDEALRCNPEDGSAHYILGRFYTELLKLPWAVRSMASSIGIPAGSADDAIRHLEMSKGSSGHDKHVGLLLYKLYKDVGRNEEAIEMIKWASEIPITFKSEEKEHAEIEQIIASL